MGDKPNADRVTGQLVTVAFGNEASRRVAWAKYYEAKEQVERMLRLNTVLEERLAEFVLMISENETLEIIEPDGELITKARSILAVLQLRPRGVTALRNVAMRRNHVDRREGN